MSEDINCLPDLILRQIFTNLPLIEQFVTLRMVCNKWYNNSPSERRLKSIYIENSFVESRRYSELLALCGGKYLRKLYFDSYSVSIPDDALIPFADNCPNIRSISVKEFSDAAAAVLPRFVNLVRLNVVYCNNASSREAIRHLRLTKLQTWNLNPGSVQNFLTDMPLTAEPTRLRILKGMGLGWLSQNDSAQVINLILQNFPNLRVLELSWFRYEQLHLIFNLPLVRNFFLHAKKSTLIEAAIMNSVNVVFSGSDFPNLTSLHYDIRETVLIDWTRSPLILQLPCSINLRTLSIVLLAGGSSLYKQILVIICTQLPVLEKLNIVADNAYTYISDISTNTTPMVNLKNLRALFLTHIHDNKRSMDVNVVNFLATLASASIPIEDLSITSYDIQYLMPISRFKFLTGLSISLRNEIIFTAFFSLTWPCLTKLHLESNSVMYFDEDDCFCFDGLHIEQAFPNWSHLDISGIGAKQWTYQRKNALNRW